MTVPGNSCEEPLEPRDRLGVEVVRRLVEQQHVGVRQQQAARARRGGARRPTASARWRPTAAGAARRHRDVELALELPAADRRRSCPASLPCSSSSFVHLVVFERLGELVADLLEALDQRDSGRRRLPRRSAARSSRRNKSRRTSGLVAPVGVHLPLLEVTSRGPRDVGEVAPEAVVLRRHFPALDAGRDDFLADAVARRSLRCHVVFISSPVLLRGLKALGRPPAINRRAPISQIDQGRRHEPGQRGSSHGTRPGEPAKRAPGRRAAMDPSASRRPGAGRTVRRAPARTG